MMAIIQAVARNRSAPGRGGGDIMLMAAAEGEAQEQCLCAQMIRKVLVKENTEV